MTIAQLIECLKGKLGALRGKCCDATAFSGVNIRTVAQLLHEAGFPSHGCETMYSGMTGERLKAQIFMGPVYYQRLKHMVEFKMHSRATGPRQILTRQPLEGRAKDGGLRFGEMERDAVISHGAASFLRDRLMVCSDAAKIPVCPRCGLIAEMPTHSRFGESTRSKTPYCRNCDESAVFVEMPYSMKLLTQELQALNVRIAYQVGPRECTAGPPQQQDPTTFPSNEKSASSAPDTTAFVGRRRRRCVVAATEETPPPWAYAEDPACRFDRCAAAVQSENTSADDGEPADDDLYALLQDMCRVRPAAPSKSERKKPELGRETLRRSLPTPKRPAKAHTAGGPPPPMPHAWHVRRPSHSRAAGAAEKMSSAVLHSHSRGHFAFDGRSQAKKRRKAPENAMVKHAVSQTRKRAKKYTPMPYKVESPVKKHSSPYWPQSPVRRDDD